jgi:hypothetical protein
MKRLIALLAFAIGCSNGAAPPKLAAGAGIKIDEDTQTVSVDDAKVPMLPNCGPQQIVQRSAAGGQWTCVSAAPNADKLGTKPAEDYALKSGTVANAEQLGGKPAEEYALVGGTVANAAALEGHAAADFLGATAVAVDSAKLGGHLPADFLAATGKAVDSAKLEGHPAADFLNVKATAADSARLGGHLPADFLAATGKAADSSKLEGHPAADFLGAKATAADSAKVGGTTPDHFVLQDPASHVIDLQGDIHAGDHRVVVTNDICLSSDRTGCTKKVVASTSLEGVFCGASATTTGQIDGLTEPESIVKVSGYRATKLVCEKVPGCSARAHMCSNSELIRSESLRIGGVPAITWYANGERDCSRWTSSSPLLLATAWIVNGGVGSMTCSTALPIACCD